MKKEMEIQQIVFNLMQTLIKFGVHRFGDSLPTIKEASGFFLASVDTIRLAYVRLKQEGYISLSTGIGAVVKVQYSDEEIQQHIQAYFSQRKDALLDIAQSVQPLLNYAQWTAFQKASTETLDELERSNQRKDIPSPYRMSQQFLLLYGSLGNDFLMRLIWQMFLFYQGPFLSISHNTKYFELGTYPVKDVMTEMIRLCREKDWKGLWLALEDYQNRRMHALCRFYDTEIRPAPDTPQIPFTWNPYKKASQLCYSICMVLMMRIRMGEYPAGSFLPSLNRLAQEMQVSLNTIRRAIRLMEKLGGVRSVNGVGTKVLPLFDCAVNCDFTDDTIQKRLLDFTQGFHILALSCRACSKATIISMDSASIRQWIGRLEALKETGVLEDTIYTCYEMISIYAPYQGIRTVYKELTQQLFWGAPLRDLHGDREGAKTDFLPYLESLADCLARADAEGFSVKLQEMQVRETELTAKFLISLGIQEAGLLMQNPSV